MSHTTSNSNSIPHESSPNTPATTLVTSPSTPSTKFTSKVIELDHSKQFTSTTPTPLGISNVNIKQNRHHPKMEYVEPLHLPQTQLKHDSRHINYAPKAEAMGKPFQAVKQETQPQVNIPLHTAPAPTGQPINDDTFTVNPLGDTIQPHPHLVQAVIFVNMYPADLSEGALADAMPGCLPIRVKIEPAVPPEVRLLPDMHYDWMSKTGTIEFTSIPLAERALAILVDHATFTPRGVWFSPYPPPYILPHPNPPTAARYIRPTKFVLPPILPPKPRPEDAFRAYFPTPAEVYDAVRPWGSLRSVNSYITEAAEETTVKNEEKENDHRHQWIARVEFWNEEEAKNFDTGFGKTASLLKGSQMMMQHSLPPLQLPSDVTAANIQYVDPSGNSAIQGILAEPTGIMYIPDGSIPPTPASTTLSFFPGIGFPPTPSPINYVPPWAEHNMFAAAELAPDGMAMTPDMTGRRMSRSSMGSLHGRPRTWSLTVGESPDGELKPTGLVADDGTIIQHGPGQHIRPAPIHGPGSNSVSGLVDYSNVFIKNLDPDINSYYLGEVFSNVGQVVSARVMRDDQGRSKGYGFVSFYSPEQAANAIARLHDQKLGRSTISVTLHEPRKLRPEKIAERVAHGLPVAYGRQSSSLPRRSMSPVRTDRVGRGRQPCVEEPRAPGTTDEIRSLSPTSRKLALAKRIASRVRDHARTNSISSTLVEPTIKALAKQDLALVPLLHDKPQLDIRIAECFAAIQSDPLESLVSSRTRTPKVEVERPTDQDLIKLREEVGKIDPLNVDAIVPIMLEMLSPSEWGTIWTHSRVAKKYGLAKQILDKKEEERTAGGIKEERRLETRSASTLDAPPMEEEGGLVPLEDLTIPSLCSLPAQQIMLNLHSENGLKILSTLGVIEASSVEKANNATWVDKVMSKSKVERGVELASVLGKKVDIDTLKRSQKLKMIKGLINSEDEKALCELILYPALLNAKVKSFVESQDK
uniref:RRM domain-containing protein n=1 Tax=Kwoniella bestiolae CBS 10118 TaxID=1296100 RepID=A0A1B9FSA5_9TREE|nr:hypothetical protein I302_08421 [Kwoniella bestiolae CBS 10118]OCF21645.1 hypothetical protein I302_08421 [Kwoniella bestiolae CBS 10118]